MQGKPAGRQSNRAKLVLAGRACPKRDKGGLGEPVTRDGQLSKCRAGIVVDTTQPTVGHLVIS